MPLPRSDTTITKGMTMIDGPQFAERLRQAVIRERITAAAWRARRSADTVNAWWDATSAVDRLIEELETAIAIRWSV